MVAFNSGERCDDVSKSSEMKLKRAADEWARGSGDVYLG